MESECASKEAKLEELEYKYLEQLESECAVLESNHWLLTEENSKPYDETMAVLLLANEQLRGSTEEAAASAAKRCKGLKWDPQH